MATHDVPTVHLHIKCDSGTKPELKAQATVERALASLRPTFTNIVPVHLCQHVQTLQMQSACVLDTPSPATCVSWRDQRSGALHRQLADSQQTAQACIAKQCLFVLLKPFCITWQDVDLEVVRKQLAETQQPTEPVLMDLLASTCYSCFSCFCSELLTHGSAWQDEDLEAVRKQLAETQQTAEALRGSGVEARAQAQEYGQRARHAETLNQEQAADLASLR